MDPNSATTKTTVPAIAMPQTNTSGQGEQSVIPQEIKGWSWGGFLLTWIWGIGNKTWVGLIALIPAANLVMSIVLGIYGREWAWKNKKWDSVETFKNTQKSWTVWGLILSLLIIPTVFIFGGIMAAVIIATINPVAQIQKADDASMHAASSMIVTATERYNAEKGEFPWNTTANESNSAYSTMDVGNETWISSLVSDGQIQQSFADSLSNSDTKIVLEKGQGSESLMHACFVPQSSSYKIIALNGCEKVTNQTEKGLFCNSGSEYICTPEL